MEYILHEAAARKIKLAGSPQFRLPHFPGEELLLSHTFTATYFDTADCKLARVGVTLRRLTEQKQGLWELMIRRTKSRLEFRISSNRTTPPDLFQNLLVGLRRQDSLTALVKLRTRRSGVRVQATEGPVAEVIVDGNSILNGQPGKGRFTEIGVEQFKGKEKDLLAIEAALRGAGASDGDPRPKMMRALDLPFAPQPLSLPSTARPVEHLKNMLQEQMKEILIHDPGTRFGKDPEELHQMRVGTRRFRALLRAGRTFLHPEWQKPLHQELAWLGQILGSVRDYDVLLSSLHVESGSLSIAESKIFERVLATFEAQRSKAREELVEVLRSERYLDLLSSLENVVQSPMAEDQQDLSLIDIAGKEFKKLLKIAKHQQTLNSDEALHRIRIQVKRLRHATELASATMGKCAKRLILQTKRVQDILGMNQDALVMEERFRKMLQTSHGVRSAFVMGQIVERVQTRRRHAKAIFPQALAKLKKRGHEAFAGQSFK